MILDASLQFTAAGGDSPTTGSQTSTNIIDLHQAGLPVLANGQGARDMGIGDDPSLKLLVQVNTAFTGGTNLQVNFQGAPDNGSGSPGTYNTFASGPVVAEAQLIAGARILEIDVPRPAPGTAFPRFLRLQYVSTGTHTAGKIDGYIVIDRMDQVQQSNAVMGGYPAGITVAN